MYQVDAVKETHHLQMKLACQNNVSVSESRAPSFKRNALIYNTNMR